MVQHLDEFIHDYENGLKTQEITQKYNISCKKLYTSLRERAVPLRGMVRKHILREYFFDEIDTEQKAYLFGFICADGHVRRGSLIIELSGKDQDFLVKLGELLFITEDFIHYNKKRNSVKFTANSIQLSSALLKLGLLQQKSLTLKFPNFLPNNIMPHFIRGYFDGDGSIFLINRKDRPIEWNVKVVSSDYFCKGLQDYLLLNIGVKSRIYKSGSISEVRLMGEKEIELFCDWIYSDCSLYLERKYDLYLKFKEYRQQSNRVCQWTTSETEELINYYKKKIMAKDISLYMNKTERSVVNKLYRLRQNNLI